MIYGIYFFALIKLIPITMTLPGIAGLVLTIGVAADANIVIFERVKEEIRSGRSVIAGIATGYKKGFAAIVDANVVTFMTAFILFALATSEVKGFAFTLGIGTLVSLFTAVLATQAALGVMGRRRRHAPARARRRASRRVAGRSTSWARQVVLLALGHDPADRGARDRRQRPELRLRLQGRHADPDGVRPVRRRRAQIDEEMTSLGITGVQVQKISRRERRRLRLPDLDRDAAAPKSS